MKQIIKSLGIAYIAIGSTLAAILEASYIYADFYLLWKCGFSCILGAATANLTGALVRAFLWLPSIITWYTSSIDYPFLMWLAPGLFVGTPV